MSSCLQARTPSPCSLQLLSPIQASACAHQSLVRSPLAPLQLNLEAAGSQRLSSLGGKHEASSGLLTPPGSSAPASLGLGTPLAMGSGEATARFATPTVEAEGKRGPLRALAEVHHHRLAVCTGTGWLGWCIEAWRGCACGWQPPAGMASKTVSLPAGCCRAGNTAGGSSGGDLRA